jgi:hypothetical protein
MGALHESPPVVDFETRMALSGKPAAKVIPPVVERLMW